MRFDNAMGCVILRFIQYLKNEMERRCKVFVVVALVMDGRDKPDTIKIMFRLDYKGHSINWNVAIPETEIRMFNEGVFDCFIESLLDDATKALKPALVELIQEVRNGR